MPINKSFSILDVSEQVKENFEDIQPSFESKNKNYQRNRKKYHDEDKILTQSWVLHLIQKKITISLKKLLMPLIIIVFNMNVKKIKKNSSN